MVEPLLFLSVAIIVAFSFDHCNGGIPRNDGLHDISGFDLRDGRTGGAMVAIAPKFPPPNICRFKYREVLPIPSGSSGQKKKIER